ncbi:MAG: hypothetical protein ACYCZ6_12775 [Polaromonas sp.]
MDQSFKFHMDSAKVYPKHSLQAKIAVRRGYRKGIGLQAGKPAIDTLGKAGLPCLLGGDDFLQNLAHLLFHGPAMACCTHTQTVLDRFVGVSNGKAAHGL